MDWPTGLNIALAMLGYLYIMSNAGAWLAKHMFKAWHGKRKASRQQKAVDAFCEAFELDSMKSTGTVRIQLSGGLRILAYKGCEAEQQETASCNETWVEQA